MELCLTTVKWRWYHGNVYFIEERNRSTEWNCACTPIPFLNQINIIMVPSPLNSRQAQFHSVLLILSSIK
jgi:hypothetical protein